MNFVKSLVATGLLGLASLGAHAVPLDSITGPTSWKLQGTTTESVGEFGFGSGALAETTWGIGEITEITDVDGNELWTRNFSDGTYLYYMLYGIADLSVVATGTGFDIYNIGCSGNGCDGKIHLDVYRTTAPIANILNRNPQDRTGFGTFNGLTNAPTASLYLQLELLPGKVISDDGSTAADERDATLVQTVDLNRLPTSGDGSFFSEVVGGSAQQKWDTNTISAGNGIIADFDANFTLLPNGNCGTAANPNTDQCFAGRVNDPVLGFAAPEPGSLALFGVMLAGLALAGRRRKNQ